MKDTDVIEKHTTESNVLSQTAKNLIYKKN